MAWFLKYYKCDRCNSEWTDEWSCMCDDDCPHCGARHMSPYESDELTGIIEHRGKTFIVLWSPDTAGHSPNYDEVARFRSRKNAESYISKRLSIYHEALLKSSGGPNL